MTSISELFYSSDPDNERTLSRRITPNAEQRRIQQECWNDLADYLIDDLRRTSGFSIETGLQGSYRLGTQIRPAVKQEEFDVDLGVYFVWQGTDSQGTHSARQFKTLVRNSLLAYAGE